MLQRKNTGRHERSILRSLKQRSDNYDDRYTADFRWPAFSRCDGRGADAPSHARTRLGTAT